MTYWREFHSINEDLAFFFGVTLNILLLIVIKKVKVKSIHNFNILLLQCCGIDMFQVITSFIVKPIIIVYGKSEYLLSNGLLRPIGGEIEMIGIICWKVSMCFCICSMPVSYIFRYRTVVLNVEIHKGFYIISLVTAFFSASIYGVIIWKFHYLDNHHLTPLAEKGFSWLIADNEGKVKASSVCPGVSFV